MTYPITPNPAIHNVPAAIEKQNQAMTTASLQAFGQQLIEGIINAILGLIFGGSLTALGPAFGSTSQSAPATLQSWFQSLFGTANTSAMNLSMMQGQVNGSTIADWLQWIEGLFGIPSSATNNFDGTANLLSSVTNLTLNSDGTANLLNGFTTGLNTLLDNADGTVTSIWAWLNNLGSTFGTHQHLKDSIVQGATGNAPTQSQTNTDVLNALTALLGGGQTNSTSITNLLTALFGAPAVQAITTVEQDIANFITNSLSGGSAPTSPNSPVAFLDNLLGINQIPHTSVLIPPSPGNGSITWDANASATPFTGSASSLVTLGPYGHLAGTTANYLTVRVGFHSNSTTFVTVTYAGQALSLLSSAQAADLATTSQIFGLSNPAAGFNNVQVQLSCPFGTIQYAACESDSYVGVGSVSVTSTSIGVNSNPSASVPSSSGQYILQAFTANSFPAGQGLTAYNRTAQYNSGTLSVAGASGAFLAGDAAGASSVTFSATAASTSGSDWASAAASLAPLPSAILGSGFRATNTSASTSTSSTGVNTFPVNFFATTPTGFPTVDFTSYAPGIFNTLTIGHAGHYKVIVQALANPGMLATGFYTSMILWQNGVVPLGGYGPTTFQSTAGNAFWRYQGVFYVYCSAGDTLQPGYWQNVGQTNMWIGDSNGQQCYWSVSLMNRSLA